MKTGLVLGKFMPLHTGHIGLINFALGYCDELIVLVCASDIEPIPGGLRLAWMMETFKNEPRVLPKLFSYDEHILPNTSESSAVISKIWAEELLVHLPPIDIVFASEAYAAYMGEFMHCDFAIFDAGRNTFPVSSTQIRNTPFGTWHFIPDAVRPYYVKKICLYGTESTGKTTLTQKLAAHFNTIGIIEMAREVLENTSDCTEQHLTRIAELHARTINKGLKSANKLLIVDTDINITRSYSKFLFNKELYVPDWIATANKFDLYLYLDIDAPFVQDGTRLSKADRDKLNQYHRAELELKNIDFELLTGNWHEKFERAVSLISNLLSPP